MTIIYESRQSDALNLMNLLGDGVVVDRVEDLIERMNTDRSEQLVLFGPSSPLEEALGFADQCRLRRPDLGVVLLRAEFDISLLADALRAGVREVVSPTDHSAVLAACARSRDLSRQLVDSPNDRSTGRAAVPSQPPARDEPTAAEPVDGQVITVFAAKGGCGKTTVAINLALLLAGQGDRGTAATKRVCLIDLDLAFGDVAIMMQLAPDKTIADAIPVADRIDETGFRTMLTRYEADGRPGIDVLLAPVQPALAEEVSRDLITELIHLARSCFDFVVIDTAGVFNEQMLAVLDAAHHFVLVTTPELPSLKSLRVTLDMFELLDYRREARVVVLNRADAKVGLSLTDIERIIRVPIVGFIPSSRDVPIAANRGVPLTMSHPQHPVSAAIRELAVKRFTHVAEPARRGLFARKKG